jgi:dipeptidyl aminopeptidase/acylaminoacyl peptidase
VPLLMVPSLQAAAPPLASLSRWTVEDVVNQESASSWAFSPDGKTALWARSAPDKEKNEHVSHLFRTDLDTLRQVQLTRGPDSASSPRWSPDGKLAAFLSSRPAPKGKSLRAPRRDEEDEEKDSASNAQIWLIDPFGGEPWQLTSGKRAVQMMAWVADDALIFAAQEDANRRELTLKDEKDDAQVVEDDANEPPVRLFKVEVEGKKVTRLTTNRDRIEALHVSPNGKWALAQHARSLRYTYDNKSRPVWMLHDLEKGTSRRALDEPGLNVAHIAWSPDSKGYYAAYRHSSKPRLDQAGVPILAYEPVTGGVKKLDLPWPAGLAEPPTSLTALPDGSVVTLLGAGIRHVPARIAWKDGKAEVTRLKGEHVRTMFALHLSADGKRAVYQASTASTPPTWNVATLEEDRLTGPREMASLNAHLARLPKARTEAARWKGANGDEVEGMLYYPHGYQAGRRYPLVVQIHGGPASADLDAWDEHWAYPANLLCQRGAFVLKPNYHGSTGYGLKWLESIADGNYCGPELEDIEKGVDVLISKGLVDPVKLALQGWSNGAILTNALITRTTRYKAAVSGAGTVEYVSDWSSCEFGEAFDRFYLGKSPLEDLELYRRKSPFHDLHRVRTATLILWGADDRVVHPQQGWALYRGLQQLGKAPVRFVQFPGEKHGLKKLSAQRRNLEESLAWLDRHLFGTEKPRLDALKYASPLAWALKLRKASRVGKLYGEMVNGILTPETVPLEGMRVGRFEVTRAQYAAFDPKSPVPAGRENYPASNVTFGQAKAYCAWLSKVTGRRYRLPAVKESEKLHEGPSEGENTLDAWAGHAVNPEDAQALRDKLRELGEGALIKEVGLGRGTGEDDLVFDLGGNVSEWVEDGGEGKASGGSADTPADGKGRVAGASPAYRGFRVVRD